MITENTLKEKDTVKFETLSSYILKEDNYMISHKARFIGFKHRMKVEFLKSFIV